MNIPSELPGAELIRQGIADLEGGELNTIPALVVSIGAPRLRSLGLVVPAGVADPGIALYLTLGATHGNAAHSRYNALVQRLSKFERALACVA